MVKVIAVALVLAFSQLSVADDLTDEKKGVIDEMLEITGALKIAELMGNAVAGQTLGVLACLLYTSPSPRDKRQSRMPSSA